MASFKYRVANARIGKEVGSVVEYDHEPDSVFLACLEKIEEEKPKPKRQSRKLQVATPKE